LEITMPTTLPKKSVLVGLLTACLLVLFICSSAFALQQMLAGWPDDEFAHACRSGGGDRQIEQREVDLEPPATVSTLDRLVAVLIVCRETLKVVWIP
jgi:hypothetical protein